MLLTAVGLRSHPRPTETTHRIKVKDNRSQQKGRWARVPPTNQQGGEMPELGRAGPWWAHGERGAERC